MTACITDENSRQFGRVDISSPNLRSTRMVDRCICSGMHAMKSRCAGAERVERLDALLPYLVVLATRAGAAAVTKWSSTSPVLACVSRSLCCKHILLIVAAVCAADRFVSSGLAPGLVHAG